MHNDCLKETESPVPLLRALLIPISGLVTLIPPHPSEHIKRYDCVIVSFVENTVEIVLALT